MSRFSKHGALERELETQNLLQQWREEPIAPSDTGVNDQVQVQALRAVLGRVAGRRAQRRRHKPLYVMALAAAAVVFLAWGALTFLEDFQAPVAANFPEASAGVVVTAVGGAGQRQELAPGDVLRPGAKLETAGAPLELAFPSGARAEIYARSRASIVEAGDIRRESLFLAQGSLQVQVPKLAQPVEFSVKTPTATVVVHGTVFRVEVAPAEQGAGTRVHVARGVVSVHVEGQLIRRLTAGQSWPKQANNSSLGQEPLVPSKARSRPSAKRLSGRSFSGRRAAKARKRSRSKVVESATLAEENELFASAMNRKRGGRPLLAVRVLDRFLRNYPQSVLTQEVRIERFRLLREAGQRTRARTAAREYLQRYPAGYARQEALSLTGETP